MKKSRLLPIAIGLVVLVAATAAVSGAQLLEPLRQSEDSVPRTMTYQGVLTDTQGSPVNDGSYAVRFSLYTRSAGGSPIWSEQRDVDVQNGVFTVALGEQRDLAAALRNGPSLYLGVTVAGGSELSPRQPIGSVPFALAAQDAQTLNGLDAESLTDAAASQAAQAAQTAQTSDDAICALERRLVNTVDTFVSSESCVPHAQTLFSEVTLPIDPALAIRDDGTPIMLHVDGFRNLRVVYCEDQACSQNPLTQCRIGWRGGKRYLVRSRRR